MVLTFQICKQHKNNSSIKVVNKINLKEDDANASKDQYFSSKSKSNNNVDFNTNKPVFI